MENGKDEMGLNNVDAMLLNNSGGYMTQFPAEPGKRLSDTLAKLAGRDIMRGHEEAAQRPEAPVNDDGSRALLVSNKSVLEDVLGKEKWEELRGIAAEQYNSGATRDEIHKATGISIDQSNRAWYAFNIFGDLAKEERRFIRGWTPGEGVDTTARRASVSKSNKVSGGNRGRNATGGTAVEVNDDGSRAMLVPAWDEAMHDVFGEEAWKRRLASARRIRTRLKNNGKDESEINNATHKATGITFTEDGSTSMFAVSIFSGAIEKLKAATEHLGLLPSKVSSSSAARSAAKGKTNKVHGGVSVDRGLERLVSRIVLKTTNGDAGDVHIGRVGAIVTKHIDADAHQILKAFKKKTGLDLDSVGTDPVQGEILGWFSADFGTSMGSDPMDARKLLEAAASKRGAALVHWSAALAGMSVRP